MRVLTCQPVTSVFIVIKYTVSTILASMQQPQQHPHTIQIAGLAIPNLRGCKGGYHA